tara:strand:- start:874 stop:1227 length:354 start_codon:yes stop_codon:yes gene_type:complete
MNHYENGSIESLTVHELKKLREDKEEGKDFYLLDVRTLEEKKFSDIGGDLLPLQEIESRYLELKGKEDKPLIVYCHHGVRSYHACLFLKEKGFNRLANLQGGIDAWSLQIDERIPRY